MTLARPRVSARRAPVPTALSAALSGVLCGAALVGYVPAAQAQAAVAPQEAEHAFAIEAGPLDQALNQFGRAAGVNVSFDAGQVEGLRTAGLKGNWSASRGLAALLAGTGFEGARLASGGFAVRRLPAGGTAMLEPVTVTGQEYRLVTEGTGSYTTASATIGKGEQRLREIPQSISVVTRQRLDEQNLASVYDALENTTGVTLQQSPQGGKYIYSRGFENSVIQYDGVPLERGFYGRANNYSGGTAMYDRVEVLRGAAGLLQGSGSPGGAVNLVRKRPLAEDHFMVETKAGSWDRYGVQLDGSGVLNEDGSLRGRALIDRQDVHSFVDRVNFKNTTFYGTLEYDFSPRTQLNLGYSHEDLRGRPSVSGLPRYSNGEEVGFKRSTSFAANWNRQETTNDGFYADFTHAFNDDWRVKVTGAYVKEKQYLKYTTSSRAVNPVTNMAQVNVAKTVADIDTSGLDANLLGKVQAFGRTHEIVLGTTYSHNRIDTTYSYLVNYANFNAFNFDPDLPEPVGAAMHAGTDEMRIGSARELGFYGATRLQLADPLKLVLGGRFSRSSRYWDTDTTTAGVKVSGQTVQENTHFTPYAGLVLDLTPQWTTYFSYTDIFQPQSNVNAAGQNLKPVVGENYELGLKGELLDGRINTAFALFRIDQSNRAQVDFNSSPTCAADYYCYTDGGKVRSQGFDAEISGELTRGWNLYAGYTFNTTKYLKDQDSEGKAFAWYAPKHIFRLWTTYQLPGDLSAFTVGGGVNVQSGQSRQIGELEAKASGRAVWNAYARYQINRNWAASLNVNNIFDKTYYSAVGNMVNGIHYGDPRNAMLTLRGTF
ncbi:TonB-dependent siderophore receptor [Bordetella genomosp. 1]|uniref:TonB-dependent siderophore receptor n=1 Tax=Bordetella genomosp. 1 TaxID=1395607 RepID=A0A261S6Z7_9BORD|nr:TonB-dependent receptor [Bordetella genomosp. 1]MDQ8035037.1 TonB-dependent siderophore receptor [Bordetella sp.]OZI33154.1 TonB-dependent siderophore receptor [Bordetella genomosp. 1]OZI57263.1 TonB-dependent siderophore receptor [Bordetella genomosp. 1]